MLRSLINLYLLLLIVGYSINSYGNTDIAALQTVPNDQGINSITPYEFFSQNERINLRDGHLSLSPPAFQTRIYGLNLTINANYNPNQNMLGKEAYVFSRFSAYDYSDVELNGEEVDIELDGESVDYVHATPQESKLGNLGHLSVTHERNISRFALKRQSNQWQFALNDIIGMISVYFAPSSLGSQKGSLAYLLIKADGSTVFISNKDSGFRNHYRIVENSTNPASLSHVVLQDIHGNTYAFDANKGFMSHGNQAHVQTHINADHCYYVWFSKECKTYLTFNAWQAQTLFLTSAQDKFGNAISIDSLNNDDYIIHAPHMDIAVITDSDHYKIWANYPSTTHGRIWQYNMDDEGRVHSIQTPEGRMTSYRYVVSEAFPRHRRIGSVFPGDPDEVIEVHYPTKGMTRYESFFDTYLTGMIVTEFPNISNVDQFYQKYIIVGMGDRKGESIVHHSNGMEERYQFEYIDKH